MASGVTSQAGSAVASGRDGIHAAGLAKEFKGGIRAVAGIDLNVGPGEIFGLLGPNGSGKTTTVEMLVTLLRPTSGHASVGGYDVVGNAGEVRMRIGVALQEVALDPLMTAWDHMRLQCTLQGLARHEGRIRAEELVRSVDLVDAAERRTRTYSGGMKRRLDLALALVHRPKVLFLDEPTTGLDPHSRAAIWEQVRKLAKEEGVAVFLTTQYLDEADALADRVAIIDRGRIVVQGSPHELKARVGERTIVVRAEAEQATVVAGVLSTFGHANTDAGGSVRCHLPSDGVDLAIIVRALDAASIKVESLNVHAPTLDDVFFAETGRPMGTVGDAA